jgi:hypothetical protein
MTLVLIGGCLEPGADGVGDYCRRLAAACVRLGVPTCLLALNDHCIQTTLRTDQVCEGIALPALRLPATLPWAERCRITREQLQLWGCTAISLQFVPYAFEPRGLPLNLIAVMRSILRDYPDLRVHLMLHEIWIGIATASNLRSRAIGRLQRHLLLRLWRTMRPCQVHTTNTTYACCLSQVGITADRLPLFNGLAGDGSPALPARVPAEQGHWYSACIFGRIPPPWNPDPALAALVEESQRQHRRPRLLLVGRHWVPDQWFTQLQERWPQLVIDRHGTEPSPQKLCELIASCQLGLATVPWGLVEKSSAVAAFLSLGVPVLASREDWQLRPRWRGNRNPDLPDHSNLLRLSAWRDRTSCRLLPLYTPMTPERVAESMLPLLMPAVPL